MLDERSDAKRTDRRDVRADLAQRGDAAELQVEGVSLDGGAFLPILLGLPSMLVPIRPTVIQLDGRAASLDQGGLRRSIVAVRRTMPVRAVGHQRVVRHGTQLCQHEEHDDKCPNRSFADATARPCFRALMLLVIGAVHA